MPTITDATVVAQAYDTSGNGGRKITQLKSGLLISALKDTSSSFLRLYKSTDGINWTAFTTLSFVSGMDVSLSSKEDFLYLIYSAGSNVYFNAFDKFGASISSQSIDTGQNAIGNVSLAINEAKTELHATWTSKNAIYANSFNIRYAKGTINGDGSVTWGAVEQVTKTNVSGTDNNNPSIYIHNGIPSIIQSFNQTNYNGIYLLTKEFTTKDSVVGMPNSSDVSANWGSKLIYNGTTYAQSSPSAIFVPQSINGLANGRIWVAWHGTDATDSSVTNIRVSYSDDLGVTWSAIQKLTSGNSYWQEFPTITANKKNEVFVVFDGIDSTISTYRNIRYIKYSSGSWGSIVTMTNATSYNNFYPTAIYDTSLDFTMPLFAYKGNSRVGFYGTWTVTTISVTPGDIGQKTDKNNILSYSITTDGEMSTITEKINGTVVNTRNTTSGQAVTLGLTQAQWDAIRFGKYADATGGKNTLTIEMGTDKWTYTFDKRLATDADIVSAVKAVKDTNEVYLPSVKKQLADAINAKGGSVSANADWLTMIAGITGSSSGRKASGTVTSSSSVGTFQYSGSTSTSNFNYITVSGLQFKPSIIYIVGTGSNNTITTYSNYGIVYANEVAVTNAQNTTASSTWRMKADVSPANISSTGFTLPVISASQTYNWIAFE